MLRKNKDKKILYKLSIIILCSIMFFLIYSKTSISHNIHNLINQICVKIIYYLDKPIKTSQYIIDRIKFNDTLYRENILLKDNIQNLLEIIEQYKSSIESCEYLKKDIGHHNSVENNLITTKLFAVTPGLYVKEAYVEAGESAGVTNGDIVLYQGMLFGRVIETYEKFSKILLIFDLRSKISAITVNTKREILLKGNNSEALTIKYLPETEQIDDGEFVVTSNYGVLFPSSINIGIVRIDDNDNPYISVPYEIKNIKYVQIIPRSPILE